MLLSLAAVIAGGDPPDDLCDQNAQCRDFRSIMTWRLKIELKALV